MSGLKPAVIGLIGSAVISMGKTVLFENNFSLVVFGSEKFYVSAATCIIMTILALKKQHPILIICLSAVIGIGAGYTFGL